MTKLLVIDNYDSFTFNLVQFLGDLGVACETHRNDKINVASALALKPSAIILSPGPSVPDNAGICLELVQTVADMADDLPIFGVCLGHQVIGQALGGKIIRAPQIMHGKTSPIRHSGTGLFDGLPANYKATRYHSLIIERATLPACFAITAETDKGTGKGTDKSIVMGLAHKTQPIYSVQFHPESIASHYGHALLANFLKLANIDHKPPPDNALAQTITNGAD
ncbi:MAG: aminodeoxychorismate/anthranilate synthase component II [Alphaproteobacteria bacterium]|nr:aminodeoxychorismate/anthranilate synthase component II [Alphaproteobacteria bacterium]